jgi:hypothetical protein
VADCEIVKHFARDDPRFLVREQYPFAGDPRCGDIRPDPAGTPDCEPRATA